MGRMTSHIWKRKFMFETTNQYQYLTIHNLGKWRHISPPRSWNLRWIWGRWKANPTHYPPVSEATPATCGGCQWGMSWKTIIYPNQTSFFIVLDDINFHIPDLVMTNSLKKMKVPQTKIVDLPIQNGGLFSIVFCMFTRSGKKPGGCFDKIRCWRVLRMDLEKLLKSARSRNWSRA